MKRFKLHRKLKKQILTVNDIKIHKNNRVEKIWYKYRVKREKIMYKATITLDYLSKKFSTPIVSLLGKIHENKK